MDSNCMNNGRANTCPYRPYYPPRREELWRSGEPRRMVEQRRAMEPDRNGMRSRETSGSAAEAGCDDEMKHSMESCCGGEQKRPMNPHCIGEAKPSIEPRCSEREGKCMPESRCSEREGKRMPESRCSDELLYPSKTRCDADRNRMESVSRMGKSKGCEETDGFALAMGYVPWQSYQRTFDLCQGLHVGTIFPELCKPFCGKRGVCRC